MPRRPAATASAASSTSMTTTSAPAAAPTTTAMKGTGVQQTANSILQYYQKETPQRTKLLDAFMAFLAVVGAIQFAYCILAGNFPFNAFLSGFSSTVGQFVLTAALRIQTNEANKAEFPSVSPERAFADYIVGSLILHFFCINFIN